MADVGKVTYKIVGDNTEFKSDVNQSQSIAQNAARSIGVAFKAAAAAGAAAFISAAKTGIEYNATMETLTTNFTTLLGGNAGAASNLVNEIKELAKVTPLATAGLAANAQTLMGYGIASDTVIDTLTMLGDAAMGDQTKLDSLTLAYSQVMAAGQLRGQEALQMINAGIPIYELLGRSMGITAAEAKALGDAGKISAEQVTEAFRAASAEGGMYAGAMEATAKTFSGLMSTLSDTAKEKLGELFSAVSEKLSKDILPKLIEFVENIDVAKVIDGFEKIVNIIKVVAAVLIPLITLVETFKAALGFVELLKSLKAGMLALNAAMLANPIALVIAVVAALVAAFVYLWNTSEGFRNFWIGLWESIKSIFNAVVESVVAGFDSFISFFSETIPAFIQSVIDWFTELPYNIGYLIGLILGYVVQFGIDLWSFVTTDIPAIINSIIEWFAGLPENIWAWLVQTAQNVASWISDLISKVKTGFPNFVRAIIDAVKNLPARFLEIGSNIVSGIWNGISSGWNWLVDQVKSLARGLLDGAKAVLGIRSPSKAFRDEFGEMIDEGAAEGITENADVPVKAVRDMGKSLLSSLPSLGVEQSISRTFAVSAANATPVFNINLTGAMEADGMNLATFVLRNLDDAAAFTVRG